MAMRVPGWAKDLMCYYVQIHRPKLAAMFIKQLGVTADVADKMVDAVLAAIAKL